MAATMRSLTSPVMAPLYWPTQARSDWIASRSACAIALAVSAGVCSAGRIGTVVTVFGLVPTVEGVVTCALAGAPPGDEHNFSLILRIAWQLRVTFVLGPLTP